MIDQALMEICREENLCGLIHSATHEEVEVFELGLKDSPFNSVDIVNSEGMIHEVVNGMYRRTMMMPRGHVITGALHKAPYVDLMISGKIMVKSFLVNGSVEEGEELEGFNIMKGVPGRKRVAYILEDTIWQTVDKTTKDTPEEAAKEVLVSYLHQWDDEQENVICQQP